MPPQIRVTKIRSEEVTPRTSILHHLDYEHAYLRHEDLIWVIKADLADGTYAKAHQVSFCKKEVPGLKYLVAKPFTR